MRKTNDYGRELGAGIKEGMKGLNTAASPKKKKTCLILSCMPFVAVIMAMIGGITENDTIIGMCLIPVLLSGACQFYVGKFKKGLIYTFTIGFFLVGALIDIFKLAVTGTFRDANGFPVIY
ncbi:hypothetical protein D3Z60_02330 [Lachnospiraceae bacterium]|jgi:hypothetical protein|nr:hypothetical protein [Lachnospiraceae bacterium]